MDGIDKETLDKAIIKKCYDALLVAIGYAEAMDGSLDWKQALDTLAEYAGMEVQ